MLKNLGLVSAIGVVLILVFLLSVQAQPLQCRLTPQNPPIQIPAQGGNFNFTGSILDNGPTQQSFRVWTRLRFPDNTLTVPI